MVISKQQNLFCVSFNFPVPLNIKHLKIVLCGVQHKGAVELDERLYSWVSAPIYPGRCCCNRDSRIGCVLMCSDLF